MARYAPAQLSLAKSCCRPLCALLGRLGVVIRFWALLGSFGHFRASPESAESRLKARTSG
eukprot:8104474-Alexandrium_andersonii.AAC.1